MFAKLLNYSYICFSRFFDHFYHLEANYNMSDKDKQTNKVTTMDE